MPLNPASAPAGPLVSAAGVSVLLGGVPVLRDLSFTIDRGETVALMGGNGSGKTTLVRTLLNLIPHQHGRIELFGTPVGDFREWWRVGYVPQRTAPTLRQATVGEVTATGRLGRRRPLTPASRQDRATVTGALQRVGMADRARSLFAELSGGQQQRVLIARALASEAEFLVLDEPLAGVDLATQQTLADLLRDLRDEGLTSLIVLHELGPLGTAADQGHRVARRAESSPTGPPSTSTATATR
ncbi:MAG: ABC transporter ATP-binding protein [Micropruina sp.]|nr:MAG: ABC transporter ATP-binding protein [Micropruina sp.]